jgi:hypothetical protein
MDVDKGSLPSIRIPRTVRPTPIARKRSALAHPAEDDAPAPKLARTSSSQLRRVPSLDSSTSSHQPVDNVAPDSFARLVLTGSPIPAAGSTDPVLLRLDILEENMRRNSEANSRLLEETIRRSEEDMRRNQEAMRRSQEENTRWLEESVRRLAEIRALHVMQVERK